MKTVLIKLTKEQAASYDGVIFAPMDDDCDGIPYGELMADIKKNRNVKNHRRYFSFIKQAFDMQEFYEEKEVFRKVLQLKAGFFDEVISEKGKVIYLPRSISWDELDELEFRPLFTKVVNAFIKDFELDDMQINSILEY